MYDEHKFLSKVRQEGDCWIWEGVRRKNSNVVLFLVGDRYVSARKASWGIYKGEDVGKDNLKVTCDSPACVNPDHLIRRGDPSLRRTCSVPGCDRTHKNHGYCDTHYWRLSNGKTVDSDIRPYGDIEGRFWDYVDKTETCWNWKSTKNANGYGTLRDNEGRSKLAHRVSWKVAYGDYPVSELDHMCHNRGCVNPEHLNEVTRFQNLQNRRVTAPGRANNKTGYVGVVLDRGRYRGCATVNHVRMSGPGRDNPEDAYKDRLDILKGAGAYSTEQWMRDNGLTT